MAQLLLLLGVGLRRALALAVGVVDCCSLEGTLEGAHRVSFLARDCDDSAASWHLEDIVAVVGDCHEFDWHRIPKDGIVRQADVGNVEVDELGVVVVMLTEGDRETNLPYRVVEPLVTLEKGLVGWS